MIERLFQIRVAHGYFSSGVFDGCSVSADADTQRLIDRYRLLSRMSNGVFEIYASFRDGAEAFVRYLNELMEGRALKFLLTGSTAQFSYITDLPLDWAGQVKLSSKSGSRDDAGGILLNQELSERSVDRDGVIGVISIYPDDLQASGAADVRYLVDFTARSLHWEYYLVNRSNARLQNPAICNRKQQRFDGPVAVSLPGGESALRFVSGQMQFPLQQVPDVAFDLIDSFVPPLQTDGKTVERCVIKGLPTPEPGQFRAALADGKPYVFSEMYVYL